MKKQSIDGMSARTAVSHSDPAGYPTSAGPPVGSLNDQPTDRTNGTTHASNGTQDSALPAGGHGRSWGSKGAHAKGPHGDLVGKGKVEHDENDAVTRAKATGMEPGSEARKKLERRLKWKLDLRFSILVSGLKASWFPDRELRDSGMKIQHHTKGNRADNRCKWSSVADE